MLAFPGGRIARVALLTITVAATALAANSDSRIVHIGVDQAAPYQSWHSGSGPVGFTVDVLNEAAARRGITLQWIDCPEGPSKALTSHKVDLWPLLSIGLSDQLGMYAPAAWLRNGYAIAWVHDRRLPRQTEPSWDGKSVSILDSPRSRLRARTNFTATTFDLVANRTVAMQHLCQGRSQGAFMEVRLMEPMLLDRPAGCEGTAFGMRMFSRLSDSMSLAAQPGFEKEADALRAEIGAMLVDGRFNDFTDRWFVFSNLEAQSTAEILEQRARNQQMLVALGAMAALVCGLIFAIVNARRARRGAEAANRAKSTFLSNVSHEIRTPMNGVLGTCDLLFTTELNEQQAEYAAIIEDSARLQLRILNELLDSATIETGKLVLQATPFSPIHLMKETERAFRAEVMKKGLTLHLELVNVPSAVLGDPLRTRQIVNNLLSNALKFTHHGDIQLKVEGIAEGGGSLLITVHDTGIGIPPQAQARIFRKFSQADESATRRFGGAGLGLSICHELTKLMGGSITLKSEEGVGTTVQVRLPLHATENIPEKSLEPVVSKRLHSSLPLLIVDDNLVNQKVLGGMLRHFGLDFQVAGNGLQALHLYGSGRFAVVLMDCQMPEMDGLETTRRIRENDKITPILAITASASEAERKAALRSGMNDFLAKPVDSELLWNMLSRWIPASEFPNQSSTARV